MNEKPDYVFGHDPAFFRSMGMPDELVERIQAATIEWTRHDFATLRVTFALPEIVRKRQPDVEG